MTVEKRRQGLVITRLPAEEMGLLAAGVGLDAGGRAVIAALLRGERVYLPDAALDYRRWRKSAGMGIYTKFFAMERAIREMGVIRVKGRGGRWYWAW